MIEQVNTVLSLRDVIIETSLAKNLQLEKIADPNYFSEKQLEAFVEGRLGPKDISFIMLDIIASALELRPDGKSDLPETVYTYWKLALDVMDDKVSQVTPDLVADSQLERFDVSQRVESAKRVLLNQ